MKLIIKLPKRKADEVAKAEERMHKTLWRRPAKGPRGPPTWPPGEVREAQVHEQAGQIGQGRRGAASGRPKEAKK